ncbi:MAG TPA: NAD(P)H-dependent oxidoreductase [Candidatus Limnocylindrales bacterium]|nr:NAD(P)H-dependent oxidoreductase [Candidatus Limnocylindrales bacterium]
MSHQTPQQLLEALNWRYATKVFDATKKIPAEVWHALEQALMLTPTSYGMQPYQFLVVQDAAKRVALLPNSWGQKQVVDCSHFVVFTTRTEMKDTDVAKLIQRTSEVRGIPLEKLNFYRDMILSDVVNGPRGQTAHEWAARQAYIALGNLMACAAVLGVDACPMEGLVPAEYDRVLNLNGSGYKTVVACALGYRAATDKYASLAKVRFEKNHLVRVI